MSSGGQTEHESLYSQIEQMGGMRSSAVSVDSGMKVFGKELEEGSRVGSYLVMRKLGSGGFGITYLAKDVFLERLVVLKENFPTHCAYRDPLSGKVVANNAHDKVQFDWALTSFVNEAKIIANIDHPGVVHILEIFHFNSTAYFAMDYIEGVSLAYLAEQVKAGERTLTESQLINLLKHLLDIISEIHSYHVCHKDIKPENILVNREGFPVLIDFGAARNLKKNQTTTVVASEGFSSPEQSLGLQQIGDWSDIYSLGATLFYIIAGRFPLRSEGRIVEDKEIALAEDTALLKQYSPLFLKTVDKAMSPLIAQRYRTAEQWLEDIEKIPLADDASEIIISPEDLLAVGYHVSNISAESARRATTSTTSVRSQEQIRWRVPALVLCVALIFASIVVYFGQPSETVQEVVTPPIVPENNILDEMWSMDSISVNRYSFSADIQRTPSTRSSFVINFSNPFLTSDFKQESKPKEILLSSVYLLKSSNETVIDPSLRAELVYLEICDGNKVVGRSSDKLPVNLILEGVYFGFFFHEPVQIETGKAYTARFVSEEGKPTNISLYIIVDDNIESHKAEALARYNAAPALPPSPVLNTPKAKDWVKFFINPHYEKGHPSFSLPQTKEDLEIVKAFANRGYSWASYTLSLSYYQGTKSVAVNQALAYVWLYRAAMEGCILAQEAFASLHSTMHRFFGHQKFFPEGFRHDAAMAMRLYQYSAQRFYPPALLFLGISYAQGWGVPRNPEMAARIFNILHSRNKGMSAEMLDINADLVGVWHPQYLEQGKFVNFQTYYDMLWKRGDFQGLVFYGFNESGDCTIRNIHLKYQGKPIAVVDGEYRVRGVSVSPRIALSIPPEYSAISKDEITLHMEIRASSPSYGGVEAISLDLVAPSDSVDEVTEP